MKNSLSRIEDRVPIELHWKMKDENKMKYPLSKDIESEE
jgi:hypothetical protein